MILSKSKKFLFIKGQKVAGSSIEFALSRSISPDDFITLRDYKADLDPINKQLSDLSQINSSNFLISQHNKLLIERNFILVSKSKSIAHSWRFKPHMGYRGIVSRFGPIPPDFTIIAAVRNPYEKIISWANWKTQKNNYRSGNTVPVSKSDTKNYLDNVIIENNFRGPLDLPKYKDAKGNYKVDTVIRFENIEGDFDALKKTLGLPNCINLPYLKATSKDHKVNIEEYLSTKQINIINNVYNEEFERFGYKML